jgi:flagellar L-ring protein precursor FlgH
MFNLLKTVLIGVVLIVLSGCVADARDKRVVNPMEKMSSPYDNGTIFKAGFNERPLFEERRPRNVGDGLIMTVAAVPPVKKPERKEGISEEDERREKRRERDEELSNIAADALVGNISMIVMEVLDNGFLLVAGGKQATVDEEDKFVRITGVVDPRNLTGGNMIQSTQVGDVRIQVDEVRIYSDRTATNFSEGQSIFGNNFQSMGR